MRFKAYARNITEEEIETIKKMIRVVTDSPAEIYDLNSFDIDIDSDDILFLYGTWASRLASEYKCKARIEFQDISRLSTTFGDEYEKEIAYDKLLDFKQQIFSETKEAVLTTKITVNETVEDPWPEYSADKVQALETSLRQKQIIEWKGELEDGRTFRISMKPDNKQADIDMTFAELYAIKALKDVLRVKELKFVSTGFSTRESNSK